MHTLEKRSKISNLGFQVRKLEKEEEIKLKVSRRKEIRIRAEINETENRKSIEKINKTESWFFEKVYKANKPLAKLTKQRTQIATTRNEGEPSLQIRGDQDGEGPPTDRIT